MGTCLEMRAHLSPIRCRAFSPQGNQILTGSNDKSIKLWSVTRKQLLKSFVGHTSWVRSRQYAPDGQKIVSCADDQTVRCGCVVWCCRVCGFKPT
nr:PREDICTED: POC1 centriolar protein homolog B-like isoform X1 [Tribolium castaneum]|eukprot:XP_015839713.1 PREDICTED: POC1 centriolar protein homolog B-like isoform X1 [Tribolium castaneum]